MSCCFLPVFANQLPAAGIGSDWSFPIPNIWSVPCCRALPSSLGFQRLFNQTSRSRSELGCCAPCLLTLDFLGMGVQVLKKKRGFTLVLLTECVLGSGEGATYKPCAFACCSTTPFSDNKSPDGAAAS